MSKDSPQWSWISERMPKGFRLVLNYGGLKLVSATLSDKAFENTWKHILLDRYHRIKDGKAFDGVTKLDDSTYLVAGLL